MEDDQATTFLSIRYKVVFIGNPTAGKTSLLNRICNNKFLPNYDSTIGVDFFTKQYFLMKLYSNSSYGILPGKKNIVH